MKQIPPGIYAAPLTPLNEDSSCNWPVFVRHSFDLLEQGCTGIALFGTMGEGPSFSLNERKEGLEKLIAAGFNPKKIILANAGSPIPDTVELARAAIDHGCAALLVAPPSFYKNVKEEGVIDYYREIIRKTANRKLKILLYHIPQMSGVPITLEIIRILRIEFPENVIGIKESEGNWPFAKSILETFPDFEVFVGNERSIIDAVQHGGSGSICGMGNLYPKLIVSLYESGKKKSRDHQETIDTVSTALKSLPFIAAAKAVMEKRGGKGWHRVRPPLCPLTEEEKRTLFKKLEPFDLLR